MSDEMIQQQRTPSAAPYVLTGGFLAGGASAVTGLKKPGWAYEAPKYASWDDAVEEMTKKDKAEFTKQFEGASEEVMKNVNGYVDEAQRLAKEWDDGFEAYKNEHGTAAPELPADSKELADLKAAEEKLNAKRAELEKVEADKIKAEQANAAKTAPVEQPAAKVELTQKQKDAIQKQKENIKKTETLINDTKQAIEAEKARMLELEKTFGKDAEKKVAELQQEINKLEELKAQKKHAEVYGGIEVRDVETTNKVKTKGEKTKIVTNKKTGLYPTSTNREVILPEIKSQIAKQQSNIDKLQQDFIRETAAKYNVDEQKVKAYMEDLMAESTYNSRQTAEEIAQKKADLSKLIKNRDSKEVLESFEGTTDKALIEKHGLKPGQYIQKVSSSDGEKFVVRDSKLAKLENLKSKYEAFVKEAPKEQVETVNEIFRLKIDGKPVDDMVLERITPSNKAKEVVRDFSETLTDAEKKEIKAIMRNSDDYGKAIESAITNTKDKAAKIKKLSSEIEAASKKLELPNKTELKIHKTKKLGDLERKLSGMESQLAKHNEIIAKIENSSKKAVEATAEVKALTEEEIAAKAKAAAEKTLAESNEQKLFNDAKKVVDDARAKLPKGEAKAEETVLKEYIANGGKGAREDFIKNGMKDLEEAGKKDMGKLLEKGPMKKGKFWGITAACVAGGMLLGKLIAPKKENV